MKAKYFVSALFAISLYWMYLLYAPFLLTMTIAALLAISTASLDAYFSNLFGSKFFAALLSSFLLAVLFFAPLGYFLTELTLWLNSVEKDSFDSLISYITEFVSNPPKYLEFLKPYIMENLNYLDINALTNTVISFTGAIGAFSAGFLKNAFLVIIFYFFAHYYGEKVVNFLQRIIQISDKESSQLVKELSSVMSVVFYSIIVTAAFEGLLFGVAISYMGYNGLLFGIMYGFSSLIPVIGGIFMWLPFMLWEISIGDTGPAIFIATYSIVVISIIADTFIKPLIIKDINKRLLKNDDTRIHEIVIFFSIIAGLSTFGFWGMILGPAITAFFLTILKLYEARIKAENEV